MTTGAHIAVLVAVIAVAVVGFAIASGSDDDGTTTDTTAQTTTTETATSPTETEAETETTETTETKTTERKRPRPRSTRIIVSGGQPQGGVKRIRVDSGDRVRLIVESDVADHIHVHGYDLFKDVAPGENARFDFRATIEGSFEIELEDRHVQIASLSVRP
jgi:hypothetical protein